MKLMDGLAPLIPVIDTILEAEKTGPPKQRHLGRSSKCQMGSKNRLFLVNVTLPSCAQRKKESCIPTRPRESFAAMQAD
jgi:hypothetical protein